MVAYGSTGDVFLHYRGPGNVRELRNCLERMVLLVTGPGLGIELSPESGTGPFMNGQQHLDSSPPLLATANTQEFGRA
jgi:DNA-binding NtrC family response regulator